MQVGDAVLERGDSVLACGCGYGAELELLSGNYALKCITGIDANAEAAARCSDMTQPTIRLIHMNVEDIGNSLERLGYVNKIVAIDNFYHYRDQRSFLSTCAALLPAGGRIGLTHWLNALP
jgi:cyclopropane fatty-acyl-phospholipid synthase-like methyltransferase